MGIGQGIGGIVQGITSIFSGNDKANAATNAANAQVGSAQQGINTIQGLLGQQQSNQNPFISSGQTSLAQLMQGFSNGTFGSPTQAPQYSGGAFTAPTAAEAAATPGYQFTQQQGNKGILQGAAAAGGAISGGTLKALDSYNTGLADSTYGNTFNRALSTYGAGLQQYQAQLQGYGAQLQGNQQAYNQLFAPSQLGETAAGSLNNTETQQGENLASEFNNQGNATAAGIIGATNQKWGGIQAGQNQIFNGLGMGQGQTAGSSSMNRSVQSSPTTMGSLMSPTGGLFGSGGLFSSGGGGVSNGANINWSPPPINWGSYGSGTGATPSLRPDVQSEFKPTGGPG